MKMQKGNVKRFARQDLWYDPKVFFHLWENSHNIGVVDFFRGV